MTTTDPQLALTHIVNAPRARVYQAFTDPEHFAVDDVGEVDSPVGPNVGFVRKDF